MVFLSIWHGITIVTGRVEIIIFFHVTVGIKIKLMHNEE